MRAATINGIFNKWWTLPLLIVFGAVWIGAGVCSAQTSIILKDRAVVLGPKVALSEVAEINSPVPAQEQLLGKISLSVAPMINAPLKLSRRMIEAKLREHQIDLTQVHVGGAVQASVFLDTVMVSGNILLETAREYLEKNVSVRNGSCDITFLRTPPSRPAPKREFSVRIIQNSFGRLKGTFTLRVGIYTGERLFQIVPIHTRVRTYEPMVIAAHAITRGKIITKDDVKLVVEETTMLNSDLISDIDRVIGREAKAPLSENRPVLLKSIQEPPVIRRGDIVTIEIVRGAITVSCRGVAVQDGRLGETIPVKRLNKLVEYRALVVSPTKVTVQ